MYYKGVQGPMPKNELLSCILYFKLSPQNSLKILMKTVKVIILLFKRRLKIDQNRIKLLTCAYTSSAHLYDLTSN